MEGQPWAAQQQKLDPGLYLVATPIGNLQDVTLRALNVLRSVSLVLAEDTRHTGKLLSAYGIRTATASYHAHNEGARSGQVMARLRGGESVALVSDAGMPGISDPGYVIVQQAIEAGIRVVPIPGACALVAAVVASGLPTDSFMFCGFLPPKQGARQARLQTLRTLSSTLVFYAPPHGLRAVLDDLAAVLGASRRVCVARELSKVHEEFYRSTLAGALQEFTRREPRGEICLVVEGCAAEVSRHEAMVQRLQQRDGEPAASSSSVSDRDRRRTPAAEAAVGVLEPGEDGASGSHGEGAPSTSGAQERAHSEARAELLSLLQQSGALGRPAAREVLALLLRMGMPTKAAAKEAVRLVPGLGRKDAYAEALKLAAEHAAAAGAESPTPAAEGDVSASGSGSIGRGSGIRSTTG